MFANIQYDIECYYVLTIYHPENSYIWKNNPKVIFFFFSIFRTVVCFRMLHHLAHSKYDFIQWQIIQRTLPLSLVLNERYFKIICIEKEKK